MEVKVFVSITYVAGTENKHTSECGKFLKKGSSSYGALNHVPILFFMTEMDSTGFLLVLKFPLFFFTVSSKTETIQMFRWKHVKMLNCGFLFFT